MNSKYLEPALPFIASFNKNNKYSEKSKAIPVTGCRGP
jgi:hypothetical protein